MVFTNGENRHGKKPHQVILRSPLPWIHYYQNKRLQVNKSQYFIPTYSWTLTPIPNWTCSVVTISPCNAWLPVHDKSIARILVRNFNHQLEKVVGCKVLQFIQTMKIKKMLGHKTLWCTNTTTFSQEWWTRANSVSSHNLLEQTFAQHLCNLITPFTALKIIFLYI